MIAFILLIILLVIFWKPVMYGSKRDIESYEYWENYNNKQQ